MRRKLIGTSHDDYAQALQAYGETQLELGNVDAAGPALTEALAIFRRSRVDGHYEIAVAQIGYALASDEHGQSRRSRKADPRGHRDFPESVSPRVIEPSSPRESALGESLLLQGKVEEAEPLLVVSLKQLGATLHYDRRLAVQRLIKLYEAKGDAALARQYRDELAAIQQQARTH